MSINLNADHMSLTLEQRLAQDQHFPLLSILERGDFDQYAERGESLRLRDRGSGFYFVSLAREKDFYPLVAGIRNVKPCTLLLFDERFAGEAERLLPGAKLVRYQPVIFNERTLSKIEPRHEPFEMQRMDLSWLDLVCEHCENEEFNRAYFAHRIRHTLALGAIRDGERLGFMMDHKDLEIGPLWINPSCRGQGVGTTLLWHWCQRQLKKRDFMFGLISPENDASKAMFLKNSAMLLPYNLLACYALDENGHCYQP